MALSGSIQRNTTLSSCYVRITAVDRTSDNDIVALVEIYANQWCRENGRAPIETFLQTLADYVSETNETDTQKAYVRMKQLHPYDTFEDA